MAGTTEFSDIKDHVWRGLAKRGDYDPNDVSANLLLEGLVNRAYVRVALPGTYEHPALQSSETITLATGDFDYTLSSTYAIRWVRDVTNSRRLRKWSFERMDKTVRPNGAPTNYARWGNVLYTNTSPTSSENGNTLAVRGWTRPTALSAATDKTVLEPEWDEAIIYLAIATGWSLIGELDMAAGYREMYAAFANDVKEIGDIEAEDPTYVPDVHESIYMRRGTS